MHQVKKANTRNMENASARKKKKKTNTRSVKRCKNRQKRAHQKRVKSVSTRTKQSLAFFNEEQWNFIEKKRKNTRYTKRKSPQKSI